MSIETQRREDRAREDRLRHEERQRELNREERRKFDEQERQRKERIESDRREARDRAQQIVENNRYRQELERQERNNRQINQHNRRMEGIAREQNSRPEYLQSMLLNSLTETKQEATSNKPNNQRINYLIAEFYHLNDTSGMSDNESYQKAYYYAINKSQTEQTDQGCEDGRNKFDWKSFLLKTLIFSWNVLLFFGTILMLVMHQLFIIFQR
jgi:flagellar biosynthesis GTPase FlhF